jgi:ankyrin repeat protein
MNFRKYIMPIIVLLVASGTIAFTPEETNWIQNMNKAISASNTAQIKKLFEKAPNNNVRQTIFYQMVNRGDEYKYVTAVKAMLQAGADPNFKPTEAGYANFSSPLVESVKQKNPKMVQLLLQYGADINATDTNGTDIFTINDQSPNEEIKVILQPYLLKKRAAEEKQQQQLQYQQEKLQLESARLKQRQQVTPGQFEPGYLGGLGRK